MAKHTEKNGDPALAEAKARRAAEIADLRKTNALFDEIVPAGWVERATGFPPYLIMGEGVGFRAEVCLKDNRDEFIDRLTGEVRVFTRYHLRLIAPSKLECRRGPNDERGEAVPVQAGQIFTIGSYIQLEQELDGLMGLECAVYCTKAVPFQDRQTGEPRKRFDFSLFTSPETDRLLLSEVKEDREKLREAFRQARQRALLNQYLVPTEYSQTKREPIAAE